MTEPICSHCSRPITSAASRCPSCGAEPPWAALTRRRRWALSASVAALAIVASAALGAYLARAGGRPLTVTLPQADQASPSPSPASAVSPQPPDPVRPVVDASFADPVVGDRLEVTLLEVRSPDARCITHELRPAGQFQQPAGLYYTSCKDWEAAGLHISLFAVQVRNTTSRRVPWRLEDFVLIDRDGGRHAPIDVRSKAQDGSALLGPGGSLLAHAVRRGLLVFRFRPKFVPLRLVYTDGQQQLVVELAGPIRTVPRS